MPLQRLDHVNIITANLREMIAWYERVLGMTSGQRPPFEFPGAWMYLDGFAIVHLVEAGVERQNLEPKTEHFAISGTGMGDVLPVLKANDVAYTIDAVPGFPVVQINIFDPDGNHIHLDFHSDEAAGLT